MSIRQKHQAFTLIEAIFTIVLTAVMAAVVFQILYIPMNNFRNAKNRINLASGFNPSIFRIKEDVRNAIEYTIRVKPSGQVKALEIFPADLVMRYKKEYSGNIASETLSAGVNDSSFNIMGDFSLSDWNAGTANTDYRIIINNLGSVNSGDPDSPIDGENVYASSSASGHVITDVGLSITVGTPSSSEYPVTLASAHQFPLHSATQTLYFSKGAVSYVCDLDTNKITLVKNYSVSSVQPLDLASSPFASATQALLLDKVTDCSFTLDTTNNLLLLSLTRSDGDSSVSIFEQIAIGRYL